MNNFFIFYVNKFKFKIKTIHPPPPPPRENYSNKNKINKKSISPIIATLLIITVSVVLGVSMYDWYSEYTRTISSDIGDKGFSKEIRIDYINQNTIYAFNEYSKAQIKSISVDGNECELVDSNNNFSKGTIQISFDESCTQNLNSNINEVVVVSDKGTYSTLLSISNSNYVFSNDDDSKDSNGGSEAIINYCPSGSFTYNDVLFDYLDIEDGLTKNIVKVNSISGGSKTSYIDITCNYPSIDYDSDSFRSSVVCDTGYLLNSLEDSCELIINYCSSGSFVYNNITFNYKKIEENLSKQIINIGNISNGSKTSYINITCNYPNINYDSNSFYNNITCDTGYKLNSSYDNCDLIRSCNSGDYPYDSELFSYPFLDSGNEYVSVIEEIDSNFVLSKNLGLLCENTIVSSTSYEEVLGCLDGYELISGEEFLESKITASDGVSYDRFGDSVSIYEDTLVVGVVGDDDKGSGSGSAYIFEKNSNGNWYQIQKITASGLVSGYYFGNSVSIYEDTIVVGAHAYYNNRGSAYIFEKNSNGEFNQIQQITVSSSGNNWFGYSVSIYEDTLVIGATQNRGFAFIYEKNSNGVWSQKQKITASDGISGDDFGNSVSIYEDTIVVGSVQMYYGEGSAYIFEKNSNGEFKQIQKMIASDGASNDWFGISVSIYEYTVVVGAHEDDDRGIYSGSAYIFEIGEKETYCNFCFFKIYFI